MHEIGEKLKLLIFFLNFDLAKGGRASAPLVVPWFKIKTLQEREYQYILLLTQSVQRLTT